MLQQQQQQPQTLNRWCLSVRSFAAAASTDNDPLQRLRDSHPPYKAPTLAMAKEMPRDESEMDNATLVTLAALGQPNARIEILLRDIMVKDNVDYTEAQLIFLEIEKKNEEYMFLFSLPYKIGIAVALTGAFASFPLVFDLGTAEWFNHNYVTTEVPETKDLETVLEVGAWTWNWMEPILGQISFFLLCLQYSRAQLQNLGVKPYTAWVKHWRGKRLAQAFPKYDTEALIAYSKSTSLTKSIFR